MLLVYGDDQMCPRKCAVVQLGMMHMYFSVRGGCRNFFREVPTTFDTVGVACFMGTYAFLNTKGVMRNIDPG